MSTSPRSRALRVAAFLIIAGVLGGCATPPRPQRDPRDPYESFNRGVYQFNDRLDRAVLRPTARAYRAVMPQFVRTSVGNFFSNINDVRNVLNNTLQGKFTTAYADFGRIAINSTLGVLGLFDIASEAGIEKHNEDFGQTLGWWGMRRAVPHAAALRSRALGAIRSGFAVDWLTDPVTYIDPTGPHYPASATDASFNRRADAARHTRVLETTLDPYQFVRDAYIQRRRNLIYDGKPPRDKDELVGRRPTPRPRSRRQGVKPSAHRR